MHFLRLLSGRAIPPVSYLNGLSAGIARRCYGVIPGEVRLRALRMTLAEAQGYLRARLHGLVEAEARATVDQHHLEDCVLPHLVGSALDDFVSLALQGVLAQTTNEPRRRRAA